MKSGIIRDYRSVNHIKPRIMDYIRYDDGEELLEVKDGNVRKTILLSDLERQIEDMREKI